jgi:predicted permease
MRDWHDIWRRLFPRRTIARDVETELEFHLQGRIDELIEAGLTPRQARAEVRRRFGDVEQLRHRCAELSRQRIARQELRTMIDSIVQDIRLAARALRKSAAFSTVVILTLALGIGATTAIFSVVNGVLLRPLPFEDPASLAVVWENDRATGTTREAASVPDYFDFVRRTRTFEALAMYAFGPASMSRDDGEPDRVDVAAVSHGLDEVLGIRPQLGRGIDAAEDQPDGDLVTLLSDDFWRSAFDGDEGVLGRTVRIDDRTHTIVGVLPPHLDFPVKGFDMWVPIQQSPTTSPRSSHWVRVIGRLAAGVSIAEADADMRRIAADLEREYAADNVNRGTFVEPVEEVIRGDVRLTVWVLFAAVAAVLLIACANVANLLLARGADRAQEVAVCVALGAGTGRLVRRFVVESLLLAGAAMALGVTLAVFGLRALVAIAPGELLAVGGARLDLAVLAFATLTSAAIGIVFGMIPTLQARRLDVQSRLKQGRTRAQAASTSRMALRRLLVAGQLAIAVVLLVSAGLLLRTLWNLQRVDPGFTAEHVLRADILLPEARYPRDFSVFPDWVEVHGFNRELLQRSEALPGVRSAALASNHPLQPGFTNSFSIAGRPPDPDQGEITVRMVTPGYFETVGLRLVRGRLMQPSDTLDAPAVVLLNEAAVARYFPDEDPLGASIGIWGTGGREVIGVVENERMHGLAQDPPPAMYVNLLQAPQVGAVTLLVRTSGEPRPLLPAVREAVWSIDRELAVFRISTMEETVAQAVSRERFASVLLAAFAVAALIIASLGVYGLLSYVVAQRGHEVGVRMALGAAATDVVGLIVRQGLAMTVAGIVVGLAGAAAASRLLESLLFGVTTTDPLAYALVTLVLVAAALAACLLPARRAARIDPIVSLRGE